MNSKWIESFICVAESLNISASAQKLYASQSTISRQISMLEEELGMKLFIRGNNYLSLTPAGIAMYRTFKDLGLQLRKRYDEARVLSSGKEGILRIGLYSFMRMDDFFRDFQAVFQLRCPGIRLIYECTLQPIDMCVLENSYDLVILHEFDMIDNPDFLWENVCTTNQFLLFGGVHPLAGRANLHFLDFRNEVFWEVKGRNEKRYRDAKKKIFGHYGIENWKIETAENPDTALFNIAQGNGCCLLDPCTAMLNNKYFRKLPLDEEIAALDINIAWNRNNTNPALAAFLEVFQEEKNRKNRS